MKLEITVPESLADIRLDDYQRFVAIADKNEDEVFVRQKMVEIFCKIPPLAVMKMRQADFNAITIKLLEILKEKPTLKRKVEIAGKKYGFIPNLTQEYCTVGEYVDLDDFMTDWANFHKAMAVMYRPITAEGRWTNKGKYLIEPYITRVELKDMKDARKLAEIQGREFIMKSMPMDVVMGAVLFFWTLSSQLLRITPNSLARKLKDPKVREALEKNGAGMDTYINSLREACLKLEMLLPSHLERRYSF